MNGDKEALEELTDLGTKNWLSGLTLAQDELNILQTAIDQVDTSNLQAGMSIDEIKGMDRVLS